MKFNLALLRNYLLWKVAQMLPFSIQQRTMSVLHQLFDNRFLPYQCTNNKQIFAESVVARWVLRSPTKLKAYYVRLKMPAMLGRYGISVAYPRCVL